MKTLAALPALALLAACAQPPSDPNAGPGATPASPAQAGALFSQVCIANLPRFAGAPATLAALPFTQRTSTGTYYHNSLNLSFSLSYGDCSLVFFTTDTTPADEFVEGAEQTGISGRGDAAFNVFTGPAGLVGVNVRIDPN